eukprot:PITA_06142
MDHGENETQYYSTRNGKQDKKRECCLCGDVGFQERLFRCSRCHHRFQHIYCSRLYSDQLELGGVNVCDWCQYLEAKEKNQSHKRKVELQEMENRNVKEVAASEIVCTWASTCSLKQPASGAMEKPKKVNAKTSSLKFHIKFGGSKQSQSQSQPSPTENKPCIEVLRNLPPGTSESSPTKGGLGRRYKLLSDVLS